MAKKKRKNKIATKRCKNITLEEFLQLMQRYSTPEDYDHIPDTPKKPTADEILRELKEYQAKGIDLDISYEILEKLELSYGFWTIYGYVRMGWWDINYEKKCIVVPDDSRDFDFALANNSEDELFYFKDYGKTWALTEEELKKEDK